MARPGVIRACVLATATVIAVGAITWPFFLPGELAWRDMVIPAHPGMIPGNFGAGDLPARNSPQDGVLALFALLAPAPWLVKVLVIGSAAASAGAAVWLSRLTATPAAPSSSPSALSASSSASSSAPSATPRRPVVAVIAAIAAAVANPFIIERLLQGHWSLAITGWLAPLIAAAGLAGRPLVAWLALWVASLSPSGALLSSVVAVATARGHRLITAGLAVTYMLPWVIPSLVQLNKIPATDASAAVAAFAPRAEEFVGTAGALLTLGGLWNAAAVPDSRHVGFALFGLAVTAAAIYGAIHGAAARDGAALGGAALGGRNLGNENSDAGNRAGTASGAGVFAVLGTLALAGFVLAAAGWLAPEAWATVLGAVPGGGLARDGQKFILLAIPLIVAGLGALDNRILASAGLVCMALQTPDATSSLGVLAGRDSGINTRLVAEIDGRVAFFADHTTLTHAPDGALIVDPYTKIVPTVESGELVVDGVGIDKPSARYLAAAQAWERRDLERLDELGVGVVVEGGEIVAQTPAARPRVPWVLTALWLVLPLVAVGIRVYARAFVRRPDN